MSSSTDSRNAELLQSRIENIVEAIEQQYPPTDQERVRHTVTLVDGRALSYPQWTLTLPKSQLKDRYSRVFGKLPTQDLLDVYTTVNLIPIDLLELLRTIQTEGVEMSERRDVGL